MENEAAVELDLMAVGEAPLETPTGGEQGPSDPRWWGSLSLEPGQAGRWRAGPSTVYAARSRTDWRLWHQQDGDPYAPVGQWPRRVDAAELPDGVPQVRFSFAESPDSILVSPRLAPRPVVIRPDTSLAVPPGERVTIYISTPTWMSLTVQGSGSKRRGGDGKQVLLADLPTHRPSDTWFGPSTREGELCYAVRTAGRLVFADLPLRPHRAVTPMTIQNDADDLLQVQRVQVPVPQLALYVDGNGRLLTDGVLFRRQTGGDFAELRIERQTPGASQGAAVTEVEKLAAPRTPVTGNIVMRAFSRLFKGDDA